MRQLSDIQMVTKRAGSKQLDTYIRYSIHFKSDEEKTFQKELDEVCNSFSSISWTAEVVLDIWIGYITSLSPESLKMVRDRLISNGWKPEIQFDIAYFDEMNPTYKSTRILGDDDDR